MRVLFVHARPLTEIGGAENSLRTHLETAPSHIRVDVVTPWANCNPHEYDAIVLANLRPIGGLGEAAEAEAAAYWLQRLENYRGFVLRSERDVHPCAHRDARCIACPDFTKHTCDCGPLIPETFEQLYNRCHIVQFLSPAHQQVINRLIRVDSHEVVIAPPVDLRRFRARIPYRQRQCAALIIGDELRAPSEAEALADRHNFRPVRVPYLSVPYEAMPDLYNQYQAVVLAPKMFHAFGRVFVEAKACGCRVLSNERVGAKSYWFPMRACRMANRQFWRLFSRQKLRRFPCRASQSLSVVSGFTPNIYGN